MRIFLDTADVAASGILNLGAGDVLIQAADPAGDYDGIKISFIADN